MSVEFLSQVRDVLKDQSYSDEVAAGRFYVAGSGRLSLSVAGNVRGLVTNPANSGRLMVLVLLTEFGTGRSWTEIYRNPTTGLPTALRPVNNALLGVATDAAVGELRVDTDTTVALSGGTNTGIVIGTGPDRRNEIKAPFNLFPGETLGVNVPFAGAADATLSLYWVEKDWSPS